MPHPVLAPSKTALITGAASGIGLAVAKLCRSHGMNLALVDRDIERLAQAQVHFAKDAATTQTYRVDVSQLSEWESLRSKLESDFGHLDLVMLNAAIGRKGSWEEAEYFEQIFSTNLLGVTHGLATLLPLLPSSTPTAIILTGSKQGITNPPGNPAYNASKAALKSLAESLSFEKRNTQTSVHLLVPGWTFTGLTSGGGEKPAGAWWPEQVAGFLERKMDEGQFYVVCPDNEVTEEVDRKRMLWGAGDVVEGRPPLSRWREEWRGRAEEWMAGKQV